MKKYLIGLVALAGLAAFSTSAAASSINLTLALGNVGGISGYPAPYGDVQISMTDNTNTATFVVTGATTGGYQYLLGAQGIFGLNANGASTLHWNAVTFPDLSDGGSANEDGWGSFSNTLDNFDGFGHAVSSITFTLTKNSGTWANAGSVLAANANGNLVGAHIFVVGLGANACHDTQTGALVACATGYATNGNLPITREITETPEPASLVLLGTGLIAATRGLRRLVR